MEVCSNIISVLTSEFFISGMLFFGMAFCLGVMFEKSQNGEELL